jgi:hypothetical protein
MKMAGICYFPIAQPRSKSPATRHTTQLGRACVNMYKHLLLMSAIVQVFGRRHEEAIHSLQRPASEKRQGTKSREVGHWLAASAMGTVCWWRSRW